MTFAFCVTLNVWVTAVAALKFVSPAWVAVIEQIPTETSVTELPDTVQTAALLLPKLTVKPEDADPVKVTGPAASAVSAGCVKLIVCAPLSTLNVLVTGVAAAKLALPA